MLNAQLLNAQLLNALLPNARLLSVLLPSATPPSVTPVLVAARTGLPESARGTSEPASTDAQALNRQPGA